MAKYTGYKRPKNTKKTLKYLFRYLGLQYRRKYYRNVPSETGNQSFYPARRQTRTSESSGSYGSHVFMRSIGYTKL